MATHRMGRGWDRLTRPQGRYLEDDEGGPITSHVNHNRQRVGIPQGGYLENGDGGRTERLRRQWDAYRARGGTMSFDRWCHTEGY